MVQMTTLVLARRWPASNVRYQQPPRPGTAVCDAHQEDLDLGLAEHV
jgi:hypothetical protein